MKRNFNELLRASFKSDDTEEWLDIHFTRPIGLAFALVWERLHVHPNVVTVIGIVLGMASAVMFYHDGLTYNIIGVLLMMFSNFCDSTDGQLARLTGQKTLIGRMLDGFSADATFVCVYLAIVFRLWDTPLPFCAGHTWGFWALLLCAGAGILGHSKPCQLADYYRQVHLYFLLGKKGSELDTYQEQRTIYDGLPKKGAFWARAFYYNYSNYCHGQERRTPRFQRFIGALRERFGGVEDFPQQVRDDFRQGSKPLMKYTNLLTFNLRAIALYIAALTNEVWLYPLFELVVLTTMCAYMKQQHESLSTRLYEKYCQ